MAARRPRPPQLQPDNIDDSVVSKSWIRNSISGSIYHKASGMRVSPYNGIQCDGREYKLTADDIELDENMSLGSGASATVWKGYIKSTGVPIALKTLRVEKKEDRSLLLNEVKALIESEGCPFLVQWYAGFASQKGEVHLVLELMDQGSLSDVRRRCGRVPPRILAGMTSHVLQGLDHLHSHSLLHNDIKPANILVSSNGETKITDFGITKSMADTIGRICIGTQTYLSPEKCVCDGQTGYSFPSDIWSLGIVIYELASGVHPFADVNTFPELFACLTAQDEPRLPDEFPSELRSFVERCLVRDPLHRAGTQELLAYKFVTEDAASSDEIREWLATLS